MENEKKESKLMEKKEKMAKGMTKIKLGKEKLKNFAYKIEDAKGNILKEKGSKEGIRQLRNK